MRPIVTHRVARSVSLYPSSDTVVSPANTAEPIEMPFGLRSPVGPRNHEVDGGPHSLCKGAILSVEGRCIVKYRDSLHPAVQKTAEPIEMPFGFGAWMGTSNHVLGGPKSLKARGNFGEKGPHFKV